MEAELPETNRPTELWDGEIIAPPVPTVRHQAIIGHLFVLLSTWVQERKQGKVVLSPVDMVLTQTRTTQPDIAFISNERRGIIKQQLRGAADLVVEVISPESRRRDRIDKRDLYEQHGVREYWMIDPEAQTVEVLSLEGNTFQLLGRWHPGEQAESRLLPGFAVGVAELFA